MVSSTTHAAVSDGTIIINDTAKPQQNVDDLSRDVAHANQTLSPIFDKEKEQQRMQTLQLIGEIGNQAADIARKQGDIAGLKAQSDPTALEAARAELMVHGNSHPTSEQVAKQAYQNAKATFGTGGDIQQAITASTAAIQGLAGGDIAKALAGASAPYLAEVIHRQTSTADGEVNKTANLMAHAVVNAALSLAKGENALAGASSAVTAEAVGMISKAYYDKNPSELSEDEKQKVSALASLAAGLAGGLVGGDTASAVSGMQTGKVTVENNALGAMAGSDLGFWLRKTTDATTEDKAKLAGDIAKGNTIVSAELAGTIGLGVLPKGVLVTAVIGGGANTIIQYVINDEVNYTDVLIASWVGAATSNTGLLGTVGWNAAGGATSNYIKGDDPLTGAMSSGAASSLGYSVGKIIQGPLDKVINPNWKNWEWINVGMGISKPLPLNPAPGVIGNIFGSGASEVTNNKIGKEIKKQGENK